MNTKKVIYDKLFTKGKVELESQRIELSIFTELQAAKMGVEQIVKSSIDEAKAFESKFKSLNRKLEGNANYVEKIYKENRNKFNDAIATAKTLGVELPKQWYSEIDEISKLISKIPVSNLGNVFPL